MSLFTTRIETVRRCGVQYCCNEYIALLKGQKIAVSMTEQGDPYENALAERMNRTIKEEMLLNRGFADYASARVAVERAIVNYNTLRPHGSCNYHTAAADRPCPSPSNGG